MIVLGLLLLLLVAVVVAAVMLEGGGDPALLDLQAFTIDTDVRGIFVAGAATVLVGVFGASLLMSGLKRSRRKRAEVKALKAKAASKTAKPSPETARPAPTGQSGSTAAGPPTAVEQRRRNDGEDDDGTDEYFETTPRDR